MPALPSFILPLLHLGPRPTVYGVDITFVVLAVFWSAAGFLLLLRRERRRDSRRRPARREPPARDRSLPEP